MDYTAELFKVGGIAVLCSVCLVIIGQISGKMSFALRIGGSVLIFGVLILILRKNTEAISDMLSVVGESVALSAFSLMLKALGIAFVSKFCSDICRDCGEATLASGVESVGKIAIISLCIPVVAEILGYASAILEAGG